MATSYTFIGAYPTTQVTGPATSVDVLRITASTIPSGVVFEINAPYRGLVGINVSGKAIDAGQMRQVADRFAAPIAAGIERMMGMGIVAGAVATQDLNAAGLVIDYIEATVLYSPPDINKDEFTVPVRIPTNAFDEPSFFGPLVATPIGAAYASLKALAA